MHLLGVLPNSAGCIPFLPISVLEMALWIFFFPPPKDKMFLMIWHSLVGRATCQIKKEVILLQDIPDVCLSPRLPWLPIEEFAVQS